MSKKRKVLRKGRENSSTAQPWIVTFSDTMTLLLTFFVLLYSMSSVDAEKFRNITYSIQQVLSGESGSSIIDDGYLEPLDRDQLEEISDHLDGAHLPTEIETMYEHVNAYMEENDLDANVSVSRNKRGVFVDIKGAILFETGSDALKESGIELLENLQELLTSIDNEIAVEGHTDNVPTNNVVYPTNWELSTARAVSVVRHLSEVESIDPTRLSAIGYGEYAPLVPNDTIQNRAANRRVNLLIVFDEGSE